MDLFQVKDRLDAVKATLRSAGYPRTTVAFQISAERDAPLIYVFRDPDDPEHPSRFDSFETIRDAEMWAIGLT